MEHMPKNCSADVQAVTAHIDKAFMSKDEKETARILQMFDMTTLADHLDDVVGARESPALGCTYACRG